MDEQFNEVCEVVNDLATTMASKFKSIEPRLDEITARLDGYHTDSGPSMGRKSSPAGHNKVLGPAARHSATYGFDHGGQFFAAVKRAGVPGGSIDERLQAALTTYGNEVIGGDGGFAVPPDFMAAIRTKMENPDSLLARCMRISVSGNSLTYPASMVEPWDTTGVGVAWTPEAGTIAQSKPEIEQQTLKLHKLQALVPLTDELVEDAPAVASLVTLEAGRKLDFAVSRAIAFGSGAGQPLGFMNSPALVTSPEQTLDVAGTPTVQAADSIIAENVVDMIARLPVASRTTAVWLIHPSAEPQLPLMTIGDQPIYLPQGSFADQPFARLMGLPVIPHQVAQPVGDLGDIMLVDLQQYMIATKAGGMRSEVSIHLWFDQSVTAFRFTMRIAGQPWWSRPTTALNGTFTQSPFVALAARDGS